MTATDSAIHLPSIVTVPERAARRGRGVGGRAQYLLLATGDRLAELHAAAASLPLCASGRVIVEVQDAAEIVEVAAPARMNVTWLVRSERSGEPGTGERCAPGQALARAAHAWAAEVCCGDDATRARVSAWVGADYRVASALHELLAETHGVPTGRIATPAAYALGAERA